MINHRSWFLLLTFFGLLQSSAAEQPADALRPAAIVTAEVPAVPPELAARLQQYQNTRGAGFAGWHPYGDGGQGILIRTRFGNSLQMHRVYEPGGRREQVTFFQEPVDGGFIPDAVDGAMLLSASAAGNENNQIYLFLPREFSTKRITDGKCRNFVGAINIDGTRMIVESNQRNGRDMDLYLLNPRKPEKWDLMMQVEKEFWSALDWSSRGDQLLLKRTVSANESYLYVRDMNTGDRRPIHHPGGETKEAASIGAAAFLAQRVLFLSDAGGEFRRLWLYTPETNAYEIAAEAKGADIVNFVVDRTSGDIVYVLSVNGASEVNHLRNLLSETPSRRKLEIPTGIVSSLEFSSKGSKLGFTLNRPNAPADAYSYTLKNDELTRWTFSEVGGLDPASFVTAKGIEFPSFDKRPIPAWYYKPKTASADKKAPVLIQIHGGPEGQSQPYFSGTTQFYLNELGVAVILPNVRGSTGYGKTYLKLDNAEKREDSVKDIGALLDWIKEQPELDASRVAVTGASYGGYMVLASLVHYGDRIKAGIDNVGIANFITFLETTAGYRVDLRRVEYGDERDPEMRKVFERISPANHAEKIRSALLVAHGKNDPRVPFSEAEQIAAKVREQGRPVWTVFAENEGHGFAKKDNADYLRAVEAMFLMKVFELK